MASMEIYTALSYDEKPYQYYKRWQLIQMLILWGNHIDMHPVCLYVSYINEQNVVI